MMILAFLGYSFGQTGPASQAPPITTASVAITPNINYFKVFILNQNNELLLVEYKNTWEPIGGKYDTTLSMEEYVNRLTMTANIPANEIRLRGIFSAYYGRSSKPMIYHYYTVRYFSGEIEIPNDCTGVKWVNLEEAKNIMTFDEMIIIYEKVLENDNLWGGSYKIAKDAARGTREFSQMVDFFKLN